jgi:hypothetical protein
MLQPDITKNKISFVLLMIKRSVKTLLTIFKFPNLIIDSHNQFHHKWTEENQSHPPKVPPIAPKIKKKFCWKVKELCLLLNEIIYHQQKIRTDALAQIAVIDIEIFEEAFV